MQVVKVRDAAEAVTEVKIEGKPYRTAKEAVEASYQITANQAELDALATILGNMRGDVETKDLTVRMYGAVNAQGFGKGPGDGGPFRVKQRAADYAYHLGLNDRAN